MRVFYFWETARKYKRNWCEKGYFSFCGFNTMPNKGPKAKSAKKVPIAKVKVAPAVPVPECTASRRS